MRFMLIGIGIVWEDIDVVLVEYYKYYVEKLSLRLMWIVMYFEGYFFGWLV